MIKELDGIAKTNIYWGDKKYLPGHTISAVNYMPNYSQILNRGDIEVLPDQREFDPDDIDNVNIADAEEYFDFTHPHSYTELIEAEQARGDDERKGMTSELQRLKMIASR